MDMSSFCRIKWKLGSKRSENDAQDIVAVHGLVRMSTSSVLCCVSSLYKVLISYIFLHGDCGKINDISF